MCVCICLLADGTVLENKRWCFQLKCTDDKKALLTFCSVCYVTVTRFGLSLHLHTACRLVLRSVPPVQHCFPVRRIFIERTYSVSAGTLLKILEIVLDAKSCIATTQVCVTWRWSRHHFVDLSLKYYQRK